MSPSRARGWCTKHYQRWLAHGDPEMLIERVKVPVPHGTIHGYRYHKCRCDRCSDVWCAYQRNWNASHKDKRHLYDRNQQLKKYGLTQERYDEMLAEQGGGCAICGATATDKRKRYLEVDHCHDTGRVRGILCNPCNISAGLLANDPARVRSLAAYLERT